MVPYPIVSHVDYKNVPRCVPYNFLRIQRSLIKDRLL